MEKYSFGPVVDENSEILILGSFPSVKSRESGFYYGHPQNRFWKVLSILYKEDLPVGIDEKVRFLKSHHIAIWDVVNSCSVVGSSDSSIKDVVFNDLAALVSEYNIKRIYINGKTAYRLYNESFGKSISVPVFVLPSTSPANAAWGIDRLCSEWEDIL